MSQFLLQKEDDPSRNYSTPLTLTYNNYSRKPPLDIINEKIMKIIQSG